jgi:DNA replication and repair protein RecF
MPFLKKLSISKIRNLDSVSLKPSTGFNLIYGQNGSGKTSLLESIYLLGRGKTFRSNSKAPIIQNDSDECVIFAELNDGQKLGFSRARSGSQRMLIDGEKATSRAELAQILPLQMLNADAFKILEGGPSVRRAFLDWGVFHVEHQFVINWRQAQKALLNRNSLLKNKIVNEEEVSPWTHELCQYAEEVDRYRSDYSLTFKNALNEMLKALLPLKGFSLSYFKGWDQTQSLEEILASNMQKDIKYGFTGAGPHRADLKIKIGKDMASDVLSRGQQKLLVIAMKLAQAKILKSASNKGCIFLVDDLPAELDSANKAKVLAILSEIGEQVFITGIEKDQLYEPLQKEKEMKLFHVEHGKVNVV